MCALVRTSVRRALWNAKNEVGGQFSAGPLPALTILFVVRLLEILEIVGLASALL